MKPSDFHIGMEFWSDGGHWRCTDVGVRTIAAIKLDLSDSSWYNGPPYAVLECVMDEYDQHTCYPTKELRDDAYPPDKHPGLDDFDDSHIVTSYSVHFTLQEASRAKSILEKRIDYCQKKNDKRGAADCRWLADKFARKA